MSAHLALSPERGGHRNFEVLLFEDLGVAIGGAA
jgi:hypothetical protein